MSSPTMRVTIADGKLQISLDDVVDAMSDEERDTLIHRLAVTDTAIERAIAFLCDEDSEGWYHGKSPEWRQEVLERVEAAHLRESAALKFKWTPFHDLCVALKDIHAKRHVYWLLYHHCPEDLREQVLGWLRAAKCPDNYTTKEADADVAQIMALVKDTLGAMVKKEK